MQIWYIIGVITAMLTCLSMRNAVKSSLGLSKLPEQSHIIHHPKALRNACSVQYIICLGVQQCGEPSV